MLDMRDREITVNRLELIKTLEENKKKHIQKYKEAIRGYKQKALERLDKEYKKAIKMLQENVENMSRKIERFDEDNPEDFSDSIVLIKQAILQMPVPKSYEEEYDTAISMAKWDVNDTITLSFAEFNCFIMDKWDWTQDFERTTLRYAR